MKTILNAFLLAQAAKSNNTGLMAASIALNGGIKAALVSLLVLFIFRVLKVVSLPLIPVVLYWMAH
ncbi:TPA: hypothetical protein JG832_002465 [Enterobacter hormaechei subsp. xiangfangensis]|nr:hypothetical protein [Enterobacter hormaechei subsp. xiangfangensis]HAV1890600.1 hypothetical protein [Enterobacter hormaechei subsp. xiangfangensis]